MEAGDDQAKKVEPEKVSRNDRFRNLHHNCMATGIWLFLQNHLNEEKQMNLQQLKAMSTIDLIDLYNDLTDQQVKRMASRADAERRTIEALKAKGKWVETVDGLSDIEAKNVHETAKAGPNTGSPLRKGKPKSTRASKAQEKPAKPQKEAKSGKGKGEPQKASGKAAPASGERKGRGAPSKNQTYTAIAPNAKDYNPKGFKPQPTSDRMVVLDFIRSKKGQQTRDQIIEHFKSQDVNVDAALYYLGKFGFCRVSE